VRILVFHGYLLEGTGSNVYNARLAEALTTLGHDVHLLSQDRHADEKPFVDAVGEWRHGRLQVRELRRSRPPGRGRCVVYRPEIGDLLPVYVADRYEGVRARTFLDSSDAEIGAYVRANIAAAREVRELAAPDVALANHLVMGPAILARALQGGVPYAVKVHGSALEYTVKAAPQRFLGYAHEGLADARAILVGSRHTAESLWRALADEPELPLRTRLGPPGVDVARFQAREPEQAVAAVRELQRGLADAPASRAQSDSDFARDTCAAARALARLQPGSDRAVAFVGKLIVSKGVDLLLAAWPLVLERVPQARLIVVGFGAFRTALERLVRALACADLSAAREVAAAGRALESGEAAQPAPLRHLCAFLDGLTGDRRERYTHAARGLSERVLFSGRLEHDELALLLPVCEALVVPSTFPESFGMVAAEAAACGVLPISAAHSGLAEVSRVLAAAVPREVAPWLSFAIDDHAVEAIAERIVCWLQAAPPEREAARAGLVAATREHWSWEGVARGVIAAAEGRLDELPQP
jgi:glycosyltransferase involved in cell wall biosynthesis